MCVLVHIFRVLNVNDVYKLVLRDSVFVANVGWQLDFVNTPLFWQHYTHARTRTHSTTPLCCLLIDGDTHNTFTTTAILSPPIMSTLKHTHQASAFVCHNPHCMSRQKSFASEKAFTMHFQRSPPCLAFVRQEERSTIARPAGLKRFDEMLNETICSSCWVSHIG